jgi:hypothetical protein
MANLRRHSLLLMCLALSIALLILFLVFQYRESSLLKLESKWLIVAGVPILIGLLAGSYIKSFKGLGIELEALLEISIGRIELTASEVADVIPEDEKRSVAYLHSLSDTQRRRIQRLTFIVSKPDYYSVNDVGRYLDTLRNLKYIEIRKSNKKFHSLIPIKYFKPHGNVEHERITEFIQALNTDALENTMGNNLITDYVLEDKPLLEVLKQVRNSHFRILPVLSSKRVLIGIVTPSLIEKRITDEVVARQSKAP